MTVANNYAPIRQLGNGATTQFSAAWSMIAASYAFVQLEDSTTGVRTTVAQGVGSNQYQIAITSSGFTVTMGTAPTSSQYINVSRVTGLDQTNPYRTSKGFQGEVEEASFDKLTAMVQDARYSAGLAVTIPIGESFTTVLPSAANRAGRFLGFDGSGNVIVLTLVTTGTLYSNIISAAPAMSDTNVLAQGTYSVNSYVQEIIQNTNSGAAASADFVVNNNLGTASTYYGNFGMNSSGFTGVGSFNKTNAVYLSATSGDLVVGTTTANAIHFVYNNGATDSAYIDANGLQTPNPTGASATQVANIGSLYGSAHGNVNALYNTTMDVANSGTSGSVSSGTTAYTVEGWCIANAGATNTWSQVNNVTLPFGGRARGIQINGGVGTTDVQFFEKLESNLASPLAGQTVTFQAVIVNNTANPITPTLQTRIPTVIDNWGSVTIDLAAVNLQTVGAGATVRVAYTFNVGATAYLGYMPLLDFGNALNNTPSIVLTALDLRITPGVTVGLNSNPPYPEMRSISDMPLCLRYYEAGGFRVDGVQPPSGTMSGQVKFAAPKRATPTIAQNNTGNSNSNSGTNNQNVTTEGFSSFRGGTTSNTYAWYSETWTANARL